MNLHDKSYRRGLAVIFTVFLFIIIFAVAKCGGNNSEQAIISQTDTTKYYGVNPDSLPKHDTLIKDTPASNKYIADMEGQRGKLVSDRDTLIQNIKQFDPSLSEFEELPADNTFEATDANKNRIQMMGTVKDLKWMMWIFNHEEGEKPNKSTIRNFKSFANLLCGMQGGDWLSGELRKKPTNDVPAIYDSKIIGGVNLIFFNDFSSTLSLKITTDLHSENSQDKPLQETNSNKNVNYSADYKASEEYIYRNTPDVYNNRAKLIARIVQFDPTMAEDLNPKHLTDQANDVGADRLGDYEEPNTVQIIGLPKHIKEVNFTSKPITPHNERTVAFFTMEGITDLLTDKSTVNWLDSKFGIIVNNYSNSLKDSTISKRKKITIDYKTKDHTITIVIKHQ